MAWIAAILLGFFLVACDVPVTSAEGFRLDMEGGDFRETVKALAVEDLSVEQNGYITAYTENFCRSSDSTVQVLGRTLLTEPSENGHRWDIKREADDSVSLTYQIGTKQADADTDLVWALTALYYTESCEALMSQIGTDVGSLIPISSVNGTTRISELAEQMAALRPATIFNPDSADSLKLARQELDKARWDEADVQKEDPWLFKQMNSYDDGSPVFEVTNLSIERDPHDETYSAAHLVMRCEQENLTLQIAKPDLVFFAPNEMWVTYRVGNGRAKSRLWPNTRYGGLGLWNSKVAVPFVQELVDMDRLLIYLRITKKESLRLTFELHKLREYIWPLADYCNWEMPKN